MAPRTPSRRQAHQFVAIVGAAFGVGLASFAWLLVQLLGVIAQQRAGVF